MLFGDFETSKSDFSNRYNMSDKKAPEPVRRMSDKKAPEPVRRFAVGDLLCEPTGAITIFSPVKVVRVSDDRKFIWLSSDIVLEDEWQCKLQLDHTGSVEVATDENLGIEYSADDRFETHGLLSKDQFVRLTEIWASKRRISSDFFK